MCVPADCEVLLLTFSTGEDIRDDIAILCAALREAGLRAHARVLTEDPAIRVPPGVDTVICGPGSKLRKLKSQLAPAGNPFVCVVDSDMRLEIGTCVAIVRRALLERPGIAFGLVESTRGPGVLGICVELDKRWSHRFLRPLLLRCGAGITVPGQFVVYSPALLDGISDTRDTFLDDLYFGLLCRERRLPMLRVGAVVGHEDGRSSWRSLLLQRIRWMKGLFGLTRDAWNDGSGAHYCVMHYLAYHGLPAAYAALTTALVASGHPAAAACLCGAFFAAFAMVTRSLSPALFVYALTFPAVHVLATAGAVLPLPTKSIRKR